MDHIKQIMYPVVSQAVKNPAMSDKAAIKAASFKHEYTSNIMADYLRTNSHREIHPDVLTAIAKHNGHREYIRSTLADHANMPKEAWQHLAAHVDQQILERRKSLGNNADPAIEHYQTEREHYLKKAQ
jgi:hypothetical protein